MHNNHRNMSLAHLLSEGYSSTVSTSRAFHDAMLMPPNRQSKAIIADSLFPNDRKKQLTQEITLEPAAPDDEREKKKCFIFQKASYYSELQKRFSTVATCFSYPAFLDVRSCPWAGQTRCSRAGRQVCQGSWRNRSCTRCSHHWNPAYSPLCYAEKCCWWVCCWSAGTWTSLETDEGSR